MIAVTGSTGHLGRLVIDALLEEDVAPGEIVAMARSPERAAGLADRGIEVRRADYDEPETLGPALDGVEKLLLISSSEVGQRVRQHRNVVEVADGAGVERLAYTSILRADSSEMQLAEEHRATEESIRESGIPFVFLRNGWYMENYTAQLPQYLEQGAVLGCADDGRISAATRSDYAAAAAAVLATDDRDDEVYELGGDEAFTLAELAAEISRRSGQEVVYRNLPVEAYVQTLVQSGMNQAYARVLADSDRGVARGELFTDSGDLSGLIGRPTTPMPDAVAAALPR